MPHALDMAVKNAYNVSLLNDTQLTAAKEALPVCEELLNACQINSSACGDSASVCTSSLLGAMGEAHRNMFDIRQKCFASDGTDCYNTSAITGYLNSETVRSYLNVSNHVPKWQECSSSVGRDFLTDLMKNFDGYVADLLNDGAVRVLIYNGDADLMCNWYGAQAWTTQLKWEHQQAFVDAKEHLFLVASSGDVIKAGSVRTFANQFTFLRVFNSGHMVPKDQPAVALEMINRFLKNETL
ncbi:hypothetical protein BBJ28_00023629 [Nothophytophthora sp. Chile5]|nr:hypothetical protein BBJ28_00023629 [Nothophytophthora sp. Chile5]